MHVLHANPFLTDYWYNRRHIMLPESCNQYLQELYVTEIGKLTTKLHEAGKPSVSFDYF